MAGPACPCQTALQLTSGMLRTALGTLRALGEACAGTADFARRGVEHLSRVIGSDLTALVIYRLRPHRVGHLRP